MRTMIARTVLVVIAAATGALAPSTTGSASATATSLGGCVPPGTTIAAGQYLSAASTTPGIGSYELIMQSDGNLVEYTGTWHPLWASGTGGNPGARAVQQGDGNLVVYSASGSPLWASYPALGVGNYTLCLQSDGNVVTYSSTHSPIWATMTENAPRGALSGANYYPSGQCTWWAEQQAARYLGAYPRFGGDAKYWAGNARANGWYVDSTPHVGSVAVFQPGVANAGSYGHVAWVTEVYPNRNAIVISEMNYGGLGVVDTRLVSPAFAVPGLSYIALNP